MADNPDEKNGKWGIEYHLEDRVHSYQDGTILIIASGQPVPDQNLTMSVSLVVCKQQRSINIPWRYISLVRPIPVLYEGRFHQVRRPKQDRAISCK